MKLKIGDKVRNKINGNIGVISYLDGNEDINEISGFYRARYGILYHKGQHLIFNTILEIEKIEEILDEDEKEYITNVIKPFKKRVVYIKKHSYKTNDESILIKVINYENEYNTEIFALPYFRKETMYKKMKIDKLYTLKELNLD